MTLITYFQDVWMTTLGLFLGSPGPSGLDSSKKNPIGLHAQVLNPETKFPFFLLCTLTSPYSNLTFCPGWGTGYFRNKRAGWSVAESRKWVGLVFCLISMARKLGEERWESYQESGEFRTGLGNQGKECNTNIKAAFSPLPISLACE